MNKLGPLFLVPFLAFIDLPDTGIISDITLNAFATMSSNLYGPFDYRASDINIDISYYMSASEGLCKESIGVGTSKDYSKFFHTAEHMAEKGKTVSVNVPLYLHDYLGYNGEYINFYIKSSLTGRKIVNNEFVLYPRSYQTIRVDDFRDKPYSSKNLAFRFSKSDVITYSESFQFNDLKDYFDVDNYYRLDISNNYFNYSASGWSFKYSSAEMVFMDDENLFPYIPPKIDGYTHIPLKLNYSSGKVFFNYFQGFYVNPHSLETSTSPREDFVPTNYLYLPVNKLEKLNGYDFLISVKEAGEDRISFSFNMNYDVSKLLIGPCSNSDYCIVGGMDDV